MSIPPHKRSKSDPPPITIEDTATGVAPQPSPDPTQYRAARSATSYEPHEQMRRNAGEGFRQRRGNGVHKRVEKRGVEWHEKWTEDSWKDGRVLLIDYVAKEHTKSGRRKIIAQEFDHVDGLRHFYRNTNLSKQAALRVIHVQNAPWATQFLLRKFNIDASNDLVGTTFGRWARYDKPQKRGFGKAAKPVLKGRSFRPHSDPWRGISRSAFGLDYLRHYEKDVVKDTPENAGLKMMELNDYDDSDLPAYHYDVFAQRLSVYVQMSTGEPGLPSDPYIKNPYDEETYQEYQRLKREYGSVDANGQPDYIPKLQTLDNGSTLIIFENSQSGSIRDTLIGAREELEQRWRRLTFYLPPEETANDECLTVECMDFILRDIFKALAFTWEKYLNRCETHVSILEDKIYENPADESRAPELWTNSSAWLKVERLLYLHTDIIKEVSKQLHEVADEDPKEDEPWLSGTSQEFDKLANIFREGVSKPTTNLSDLMYKSVGIRDARHSLQLGLSMWRLSWITFIFLPLTFVSGFFGMNVDTFDSNPSIKWYFITTVPLFAVVTSIWYGVKHTLPSQHQNPLRRGVYETLYHDLADAHPRHWTRRGPREGIVPIGWWSATRWHLLQKWFDPDRTIGVRDYDAGDGSLGMWSRTKRYLVKRWLNNIKTLPPGVSQTAAADVEAAVIIQEDVGAVAELMQVATPVAVADADPTAASRMGSRMPLGRLRSLSPARSEGRPASRTSVAGSEGGNSGVMVEEKSEDERSGSEDGDEGPAEGSIMQRLHVPVRSSGEGLGGR